MTITIDTEIDKIAQELNIPKVLRDQWAQELESGEYRQTTGLLKDKTGAYCCLGVAAEHVLGKEFHSGENGDESYYLNEYGGVETAYLSPDDAKELDIDRAPTPEELERIDNILGGLDISVANRSIQSILSLLNDAVVNPNSFSDIAKVVRAIG